MQTCYIVGAGAFTPRDFAPVPGDLVIAADGGYRALRKHSFMPHLILGDFDSLGFAPEELPAAIETVRYPVQKDDTDTGLALRTGFERGFKRFLLYGCGGGRLDHLLANVQSMCRYQKLGAQTRLIDDEYDLFALHNGTLTLPARPEGTLVSVFCHGERATGVTLTGLQYPLNDHTLTCDLPLGVSNHMTREEARVSVKEGTLVVMVYRTRDD